MLLLTTLLTAVLQPYRSVLLSLSAEAIETVVVLPFVSRVFACHLSALVTGNAVKVSVALKDAVNAVVTFVNVTSTVKLVDKSARI